MIKLPPRTRNKDHIFENTKLYGEDDQLGWDDGKYAVLKHSTNNVKLYIDASQNDFLKMWRYSDIIFKYIEIVKDNLITLSTSSKNFAKFFNDNTDTVKAKLEINNGGHLITYKNPSVGIRKTLTTYNGVEKDDLPIEYKNKYSDYVFDGTSLKFNIKQFSQWGSASLFSVKVLESSGRVGQVNEIIVLEVEVRDTNNEPVESAPVYFSMNDGQYQDIEYTDGNFSLTNELGIAQIILTFKTPGITKLIAHVDYPSKLQSVEYEVLCVEDETEVYITDLSFKTKKFVDDPNVLFTHIERLFEQIEGIAWSEMGFNQTLVIDDKGKPYDQTMVFMKKVKFDNTDYMDEGSVNSLRTQFITSLSNDQDLSFKDVEIRTSRRFVNIL